MRFIVGAAFLLLAAGCAKTVDDWGIRPVATVGSDPKEVAAVGGPAQSNAPNTPSVEAPPVEHLGRFEGNQFGRYQRVAGEYKKLVAAVALSDEQKAKLKVLYDNMDEDLDNWVREDDHFADLRQQEWRDWISENAWEGGSYNTRVAPASPRMLARDAAVLELRQSIIDQTRRKAYALLTEAQRNAWAALRVEGTLRARLEQLELRLTQEQWEKARSLCAKFAPAAVEAESWRTMPIRTQACMNVWGLLMRAVVTEVLNDEQVGAMMYSAQ